jgi:hypothetical protein
VPDYEVLHNNTDPDKLWQAIIKMYKVDCVSNVMQVKELFKTSMLNSWAVGAFDPPGLVNK